MDAVLKKACEGFYAVVKTDTCVQSFRRTIKDNGYCYEFGRFALWLRLIWRAAAAVGGYVTLPFTTRLEYLFFSMEPVPCARHEKLVKFMLTSIGWQFRIEYVSHNSFIPKKRLQLPTCEKLELEGNVTCEIRTISANNNFLFYSASLGLIGRR